MAVHNDSGRWGEDLAEVFLRSKGYCIAHRNWRVGHYEIDIIAVDGDTFVFVEVKTRAYNHLLAPQYAVDIKKARYLRSAATAYIKMHRLTNRVRFDVISITGSPTSESEPYIEHLIDAFNPMSLH